MHKPILFVVILGMAGVISPESLLAAKVEEQIVGPVTDDSVASYIVSPRGVRLATVARKGSRVVVTVDGVEGPRFDEILEPSFGYIDPRPYEKADPDTRMARPKVVFSKDGRRFAYLARQGEEWVVVVDHKESFRLPAVPRGNTNVRMEFSGETGQHFLFARSGFDGFELWVDGQKWPGFYASGGGGTDGTVDPIISPDGAHVACVMHIARGKPALIIDGKEAGYIGTNLQFTSDSKHLVSIARTPRGESLLVDGKPQLTAPRIAAVHVAPVGSRIIAVVGEHSTGHYIIADGKPVDATRSAEPITHVIFSPDGKRYAAICGKANSQFVVLDGKKGQEYQSIDPAMTSLFGSTFLFSPDSSKLVYVATAAGKQFIVINDDESEAFDIGALAVRFSPDGRRTAYSGRSGGSMESGRLYVDGKLVAKKRAGDIAAALRFSPDGSRYAYNDINLANLPDGGPVFVGDAKEGELAGRFDFSPDGKHLAVAGYRGSDQKRGLFVDGQLVYENSPAAPRFWAFTPDNQHLFWMADEMPTTAGAAPGAREWVAYLDGKPVARCDRSPLFDKINPPQIKPNRPANVTSAWNVGADGTLIFVGPVGDVMKRFTITPTPETSVAGMMAEAKSGAGTRLTHATSANPALSRAPAGTTPPPQPAGRDPVAEATKKATAKVDAAAAKARSFLESLTKKK